MKADIKRIIEIPEGIEVHLAENEIILRKGEKELKRKFNLPNIKIVKNERNIEITSKNATKKELKLIGTMEAHIKNMIYGLENGFVYKLEICSVHFPMSVKVEGDKVVIKNFLGEKTDRIGKILDNVEVKVDGKIIEVSSYDLEAAGQTAANIEKATKISKKDRRIFQDGIFIIEKPRRKR